MIRDELAKRLKYYRNLSNLNVNEVGKLVGKSGKTISAWETGRGQPDADMLIMLCKIYKIKSISELYGEIPQDLKTDELLLLSFYRKLSDEGKSKLQERAVELETLGFTFNSAKGDVGKMA